MEENKQTFMARTKKNLLKYHESFFEFLKDNLTLKQIEGLSLKDSLSLLLSATDPNIKKFGLKKFLFGFGIRKIIQTRNAIYKSIPSQKWKIKEEFSLEGSEQIWIDSKREEIVEEFNPKNFDWMGDEDSFFDIRENSEIDFINTVNRTDFQGKEDFLFGKISELPEEFFPILKETLFTRFSKESFEIELPELSMTMEDAKFFLKENPAKEEDVRFLFEFFKTISKFITKKDEKKVLWKLFLSPEISSLELERKYGFFEISHLKITDSSSKPKKLLNSSEPKDN